MHYRNDQVLNFGKDMMLLKRGSQNFREYVKHDKQCHVQRILYIHHSFIQRGQIKHSDCWFIRFVAVQTTPTLTPPPPSIVVNHIFTQIYLLFYPNLEISLSLYVFLQSHELEEWESTLIFMWIWSRSQMPFFIPCSTELTWYWWNLQIL